VELDTAGNQGFLKQFELGAFAATVDALDGDEFARRCEHVGRQFNQRREGPQRRERGSYLCRLGARDILEKGNAVGKLMK
jgi:hypothetical protein